ncbi:MAG: glycosyltransferase family 2 protein [Cyanobacteriota bacterium]
MLTVVICTCNRPEFLRKALQSVQAQTALSRISKVIVSENGGVNASQSICETEFPSLPIDFIFQDPPRAPGEHFLSLESRVSTPYLAILHDDDWWLPHHIQSSLEALSATNSLASFSNYDYSRGPSYYRSSTYRAPVIWAFSGFDFDKPVIPLDPVQVFLLGLVDANFHFSSFVGEAFACWSGVRGSVSDGNIYDTDRAFPIFVSQKGPICYLPEVSTVVRVHPGQDSLREIYRQKSGELMAKTTASLQSQFPELAADAAAYYNGFIKEHLSLEDFESLLAHLPLEQLQALSGECGLDVAEALRRRTPYVPPKTTLIEAVVFRAKCTLKPIVQSILPASDKSGQ